AGGYGEGASDAAAQPPAVERAPSGDQWRDTGGTLAAADLRCDFFRDPIGVDTPAPRLTWVLRSPVRGARQTAWQIQAALSPGDLERGDGLLWDSGRVASDEQGAAYGGPPPDAHQACYWRVRAWDEAGHAGRWSEPARCTRGPQAPEEWGHARWIAAPETVGPPEDRSGPMPIFRRSFRLSGPPRRALLYGCGLGFHEFRINGARVGEDLFEPGWTDYRKTCRYSAYDVTDMLREGENALGLMLGNGFYRVTGGRYVKYKGSFGPPRALALLRVNTRTAGWNRWGRTGRGGRRPARLPFRVFTAGRIMMPGSSRRGGTGRVLTTAAGQPRWKPRGPGLSCGDPARRRSG
ncbi:MAG TPA: alpha-L-rhamnosidase N-terminal domain-containing protein, partial [Candidatus Hydrogenedentes bacterium]|nr:alpha-L-rhamnosidase N-terminal domain-containing protein [Candidatus Hydrogenedentota bacterium]